MNFPSYEERVKRGLQTANVGEKLLAKGLSIVYLEPGRPEGEMVEKYPDGSKNVVRYVDDKEIREPYYAI